MTATEKMRRRVLVIDDDRVASDMIVKTLPPRGLDVSVAASADRGVEKAREWRPDLIFISLFFSASNGLKISRRIHTEEGLKKVPVVMLISYRGELDPKYTSTIGIVDVLVKPLKPEDIVAKARKVLGEEAVAEESAGESPVQQEGEADVIPREEEAVLKVEEPPIPLPERAGPFEADLSQDQGPNEAEQESGDGDSGALGETAEFLKEEAGAVEEPGDNAAAAFPDENGTPYDTTAVAFGEEILPEEGPRRLLSGRKLIVFAVVFAALVLGLGTYGLNKIFSRSPKAAPAKVTTAARGRRGAAPDEAVDRPSMTPPGAQGQGVPKGKAGAAQEREYEFTVQVGAFGSEKNAVSLAEKMRNKGLDVFIEKDASKPLYRVLVGRFGNTKQASQQAEELRKEGLKAVVRPGKG